ncbi:helix-turn-helix domain-containing protein [Modestobacter sp. VKM Ac-2978]|uniref:AraC-like ligand-binding domain-containing protein n=1 Tax=Modestobacter sp. VKM Ac-2978 TaxID=3004132 RepID=UPI0022AB2106|nr:helix-turn-helix domain-containing protein [Modestobacter sp. VKM Ac-2978]MCZ2849873.1 helix-turn-helix domain-containing protein [Modestobacter sp. VKM Ac-2978]
MAARYFSKRHYTDATLWNQDSDSLVNPTRITPVAPDGFWLEAEAIEVNGVRLAVVTSTGHIVERTRALIERTRDPRFTLTLQMAGSSHLSHERGESQLVAGDITITDSARPYRRVSEGLNSMLVVVFPQQLLNLPPGSISMLIGSQISGRSGVAAINAGFLRAVADNLDALQAPMGLSIVNAVIDLTTTLMGDTLTSSDVGQSLRDIELLMSVRNFIMENLGDADLDPTQIAGANYISVRQLHILFSRVGVTVSRWIRDRRLEMCRRDLADPLDFGTPVRVVAERWGFRNPTYFARVFNETYGLNPREYRKVVVSGPHAAM